MLCAFTSTSVCLPPGLTRYHKGTLKKLLIAFEYYFQQHFTHSASLNESRSFGDALLTLIWAKVEKKKN